MTTVKIQVPYKSQLDNWHNPSGSCNVTSIAMCLEFLKTPRNPRYKRFTQFEDELYQYALDYGLSRHSPKDLARLVGAYGKKDLFTEKASIENVQDWLSSGNPCVTHGYFTNFGHIIAIVGFDDNGFLVHDPWGEWYEDGYDRNEPDGNNQKGKYQHYSYDMMARLCIPDGDFWIHFISR